MMVTAVNDVVLPGDALDRLLFGAEEAEKQQNRNVVVGPGLRRYSTSVLVTKPGVLRMTSPNIYWVDSHQKRYIPQRNEHVIGIVTGRFTDMLKVDIGSAELAVLSLLAFEGASKQFLPNVKIGDIVYCKLLVSCADSEPELVCIDAHGKREGMGLLPAGGFLFRTSLDHARNLLNGSNSLPKTLGKTIKFEIAVGVNGRIWIKSQSVNDTLAVMDAIEKSIK